MVAAVEAAVCGLGPLQPLVDDPEVSDILVNAPDEIFAERAGRLEATDVVLGSARELIEIAERIAALAGRELSVAHPIVDARMPDGSRVNAVIPPVGGPYLSIRKFNRLRLDLVPGGRHGRDWVTEGGMNPEMADFLGRMVRAKANVLVAGETGAGKTTLLRSLTDLFDPSERVGVVEDTAELALENPDRFNLETIHPHDLAAGEAESRLLDVGDLVANALRMRPDRLIVGEIRLPKEAFYTLQALHTGHDGSATTIHASSAEDALFRLELLARQSMRDLTVTDLRSYIARVFDLVVVLRRLRSGRRIVRQIAALDGVADDGGYRLVDVFRGERDRRHGRDPLGRDRGLATAGPAGGTDGARGRAMDTVLLSAILDRRRGLLRPHGALPGHDRPTRRVSVSRSAPGGRGGSRMRRSSSPRHGSSSPRGRYRAQRRGPIVLGLLGLLLSPLVAARRGWARPPAPARVPPATSSAPRRERPTMRRPAVLRAMVNRAAAGGTYPDLFTAAVGGCPPPLGALGLRRDDGPLLRQRAPGDALLVVRRRQASRNLRLVYDALIVAARTQQPASAAGEVLASLGEAARANRVDRPPGRGREQGPAAPGGHPRDRHPGACSCTSSAVNPELIAPVTSTALGQYVLLPAAVLLEVAGIVLSWRVTRLEA